MNKLKLVSSEGEILEVSLNFFSKYTYINLQVDEDVAIKSGLIKNMIEGEILGENQVLLHKYFFRHRKRRGDTNSKCETLNFKESYGILRKT